jgi:hypothetical protein
MISPATPFRIFFCALAYPANLVCDRLHVADENERSIIRMLVNTLIWTTLGVVVVICAS